MMMSRKALLKRVPKQVQINGEAVYVRSLTIREALAFDEAAKANEQSSLRYLVSTCVVDEAGTQVFAADDDAIGDIPVDVVKEIADAVLKVSAPGSVEKAAKN
jgi:hypothetical protein